MLKSLEFTALNKFEQNVCKALKVRESQKVALPGGGFSTGFSTDSVETLSGRRSRVSDKLQLVAAADQLSTFRDRLKSIGFFSRREQYGIDKIHRKPPGSLN